MGRRPRKLDRAYFEKKKNPKYDDKNSVMVCCGEPKDRDGLSRYSDASLILLDSNNNPKVKFTFVDAFPVSLQGLDFEISTGSTEYMTGVAMFKYSYYEIETF